MERLKTENEKEKLEVTKTVQKSYVSSYVSPQQLEKNQKQFEQREKQRLELKEKIKQEYYDKLKAQ